MKGGRRPDRLLLRRDAGAPWLGARVADGGSRPHGVPRPNAARGPGPAAGGARNFTQPMSVVQHVTELVVQGFTSVTINGQAPDQAVALQLTAVVWAALMLSAAHRRVPGGSLAAGRGPIWLPLARKRKC